MASFILLFVIIEILVKVTGNDYKEYIGAWHMNEMILKYNITEDVLISILPQKVLQVKFRNVKVKPGDVVSHDSMVSPPSVTPASCNDFFAKGHQHTIIMVDPDAPGTKRGYQRLHWLVVGIPGCDVNEGMQVADYHPPMPSPGSGLHRFVICQYIRATSYWDYIWGYFSVYQDKIKNRQTFSLAKYVRRNKYGDPYACNFVLVQNDIDAKNIRI